MKKTFSKQLKNKIIITFQAVKFVYSKNKFYLILVFIGELLNALRILPYMYLLKTAVTMLTERPGFRTYILYIYLILLTILVLELANAVLNKLRSQQKMKLDFRIKDQMIEKTDSFDYYTLSTKEYYLLRAKAMEGYGQGCIEKNVSLVFSIVSNVILLAGIVFTISSLGFVLLLPICMTILVRVLSEYFDRSANYIRTTQISEINRKSNYFHQICEKIQYAKEIRVFHLEDRFDIKLKEVSNEKMQIWKKYLRIFKYSSATHIIADIILQSAIYLILAYRVLVLKTITMGDFVFFFTAYQQIQSIMGNLALNHIKIFMNASYLDDFMKYWNFKSLKSVKQGKDELDYSENDDIIIEFHNVSFRYPNTEFDALSNINVQLKKGESYLIVGKNGAGKSTFVKLLCRLYSPTTGSITLNGKNILEYDRDAYLSMLSVLFQDYKILNLTIADNISSMEPTIQQNVFDNAVSDANIIDKIQLLPGKERTPYGKAFDGSGIEFSGGEAQKVMIAKTLYKKAPLKIFDEPTSGLDAVSEYKIYENIKRSSKNGILIYITHRLSTGVSSDNILVFSRGKISETGNHRQLMNLKGTYASLFESQAALYAGRV